jgi:CheY-like chemotaxis protein
MEEETQARIFEPFFTTKFKGRGLGMAAVMGILRAHKGALWLESQPGQGTLLRLLFPTLSRPVSAPPRQIPGVAVSANGTVLVVDDEESVREVTGSMLKDLGFRVHLAPDSHQALEFLRTGPSVRLVLLDLTMPGLTGNKALCAIQQVRPHLPVILMSGFSEDELSQRYADCGFAGFLHKPFCQGELGIKLKSVLAD